MTQHKANSHIVKMQIEALDDLPREKVSAVFTIEMIYSKPDIPEGERRCIILDIITKVCNTQVALLMEHFLKAPEKVDSKMFHAVFAASAIRALDSSDKKVEHIKTFMKKYFPEEALDAFDDPR